MLQPKALFAAPVVTSDGFRIGHVVPEGIQLAFVTILGTRVAFTQVKMGTFYALALVTKSGPRKFAGEIGRAHV